MKTTLIAHSPDADDIFMYYAIKFGWVDMKDTQFDNIAKDIQTLNEDALNGVYDIVAISFCTLSSHTRRVCTLTYCR